MPPTTSRIERQIPNLIRSRIDPDLLTNAGDRMGTSGDLESPYAKVAVFVDGCYWHGCPAHAKADAVAETRRARDAKNNATLDRLGWQVFRIWEHDEDIAPFIDSVVASVAERAESRRTEVLAHLADHGPNEWCDPCEGWPHESITREDGWCRRCLIHADDHEWSTNELKLFAV